MELKSDLSKVKVGDWVCTAGFGWVKVQEIRENFIATQSTTGKCGEYYLNGHRYVKHIYPVCFPVGQVPQPYLDLFGAPPREFKDGDRVWVWNCGRKYPRIFSHYCSDLKYKFCVHGNETEALHWEHCAPWNNGVPPEGE